ncbi:MAG: potassium transporter TrkG, partial [Candidatus Micrarchaeota archaeon]|nr:potassium transporter TrkG [Candidatus Micrarchaeota archaeon]
YLFSGHYSVENAFFESMSGWTATGLSFAQDVASFPQSLLFFRSFTQWIGGVGIVLFALLVLRAPAASQLLRAESRDAVALSVVQTAKLIWGIYLVLTLLGVLLLVGSGMDWFSAVNLAMAALATGGFIPTDSLAATALQKLIFVLLMVWGGTAFALHLSAFRREFYKFWENTEYKIMLAAIVLFSLLIVAATAEPLENAFFHVASALSGTGFSLEALGGLGDFGLFLLFLLMISGACSGSTTGAIKLWRTFALLKSLVARVRQVFLPQHAVQVLKVNRKILKQEDVVESGTFVFLYLFVITVAAGILMALGLPALESLFLSASALGNVGLSVGASWFSFPLIGKAVLFVCMWLGRIEILPSLVLFRALRHPGE